MRAIISVVGKDSVGILARVSSLCATCQVNVVDVTQTILQDMFAMVMIVDISKMQHPLRRILGAGRRLRQRGRAGYPCHARRHLQLDAQYLKYLTKTSFCQNDIRWEITWLM